MMSNNNNHARARTEDTPEVTEADLANEKMGRNSLQGDDQQRVRNQRHAVPDVKREADADMIETMKKADKDYRAETDLGKGRRYSNTKGRDADRAEIDADQVESSAIESALESDWKDLEQELAWFGTRLDEMRAQAEVIGPSIVDDLEQRYEDITKHVIDLKEKTIERLDESVSEDSGDHLSASLQDGAEAFNEPKAGGEGFADKIGAARQAVREKVAELDARTAVHRERFAELASETGERVKSAASGMGQGFGAAWETLKRDVNSAYKQMSESGDDRKRGE